MLSLLGSSLLIVEIQTKILITDFRLGFDSCVSSNIQLLKCKNEKSNSIFVKQRNYGCDLQHFTIPADASISFRMNVIQDKFFNRR